MVEAWDRQGKVVQQIAELPLAENIPQGFDAVPTGPRSFMWRSDVAAALYWVEAQDEGDPRKEAAVRDKLFCLEAPFAGSPREVLSLNLRYDGIQWGNGDVAIIQESQWKDRHRITNRIQPDASEVTKELLFDRCWEDRYNDPGSFTTTTNESGHTVLLMDGENLYLIGEGASPEGNRPFVDRFDLMSRETERQWRSESPHYEVPIRLLDPMAGHLLTRRESQEYPPNYFLRHLGTGSLAQITAIPHPYPQLKDIQKEFIKYQRADGVDLTATLYLPPGHDEKAGPLPVLMWAYPQEYKSLDAAGQVTDSPHRFVRLSPHSPLVWLALGYAILDNASMPIVGEGDSEPNDTYIEQLVSSAQAAIDTLVERGVADRERIAVGGHSYGAFMTANLLAHSDLFAAGIARSGAYNRTLTPFGFQAEERTFWEAPETYTQMSPFMHADKVTTPLLLIHGEMDNNAGTYPVQSERFFHALKGHGATVKLVMLPHESHGYRARESVLHMLYEMTEWLEKYLGTAASQPQ